MVNLCAFHLYTEGAEAVQLHQPLLDTHSVGTLGRTRAMAGEQAEQVSQRKWDMGFECVISEREQDMMVADSPVSPLRFRRVVPCCVSSSRASLSAEGFDVH